MRTRSQISTLSYIVPTFVGFDFDAASAAWKANKISQGNGTYAYKCGAIMRNGEPCSQKVCGNSQTCKRHNKK